MIRHVEKKAVVLIRTSTNKRIVDTALQIEERLKQKKFNVLHLFGSYDYPFDPVLPPEDIHLAIAIGGDGTALKAVRICAPQFIPVLPVKVGDFGFISDILLSEWEHVFDRYLQGKENMYVLDMLELRINDNSFYSLNDITICTSGYGILRTTVSIDTEFLSRFRSDGLLISTATGSTAHSLSLGGPILESGVKAMIFTPIAPFALSSRPLILPLEKTLHIQLDQSRSQSLLVVDGKVRLCLLPGVKMSITQSPFSAQLIQSSKRLYFEVLRRKLGWSGEFRKC